MKSFLTSMMIGAVALFALSWITNTASSAQVATQTVASSLSGTPQDFGAVADGPTRMRRFGD